MEIKSDFKVALKTYGGSLLGVFLSVILYFSPINFVNIYLLNLLSQITSIFMFIAFIYTPIWNQADKDRTIYERLNKEPDKKRSIKISAMVSAPYFIWSIIIILIKLGVIPQYLKYVEIFNAQFNLFYALLFKSYHTSQIGWTSIILSSLLPFIIVLTVIFAYHLGFKGITLKEFIIYKKSKEEK